MLFLLFGTCSCWWGHAHAVIGHNAKKYLTQSQASSIEKLISSFNLPKSTITTSAGWQDDLINENALTIMGQWHYSDEPYVIEPFSSPLPDQTYNVTSYLISAWKTLLNPTTTDKWALAFHLRSIIHFVGDIHTPHHNVGLFSNMFPHGDMGGNLYTITCEYGSACMNIHFLWDSVGRLFLIGDPRLPFWQDKIAEDADALDKEFPSASFTNLTDFIDPNKWSQESYEIAKALGYSTPMNEPPSDDYMAKMRASAKRRVAMAGYRLGKMLKILADKNVIPQTEGSTTVGREVLIWLIDAASLVAIVAFLALTAIATKSSPSLAQFEKI